MGKSTGFIDYERKNGFNTNEIRRLRSFKEFHHMLSEDDQRIQAARCMECGIPFCQSGIMIKGMVSGCPLNNLIPEWNDLIFKDKWEIAFKRLLKTNPFPEFTGRVCPAPCEGACTVGLNGDPVSIKENERSIIDRGYKEGWITPNPPKIRNDKKIAVIGSGPSGLSLAYNLNQLGYNVTVYEKDDRIGGLLMYGIPNMKLDKKIIENRVEILKAEGIIFKTGINVGVDISGEELQNLYDKVVICTGSPKGRRLFLEKSESKGIYLAIDFLKAATKSYLDSDFADGRFINVKDKDVVIIGGGDTGTDCVATSLRLQANSVKQIEIMDKPEEVRNSKLNPWPEYPKTLKVDYGQEEFFALYESDPREYNKTVKGINVVDGNISSIETIKVNWIKDRNGGMHPEEINGTEETIKCDVLLLAMGFVGCEEYLATTFNVSLSNRGNIETKDKSYETNMENLYVCGDARRGQSLVVWAIREGIEAAIEIHNSFK